MAWHYCPSGSNIFGYDLVTHPTKGVMLGLIA